MNTLRILPTILTSLIIIGCNNTGERIENIETTEVNVVATAEPDTASIVRLFRTSFKLPDTTTIQVTRIVTEDAGKYLVLAEMRDLRKKITDWNNQIAALQFIGNDHVYLSPTWYVDIEDHADMVYHANKLFLEYDEKVESILEDSYKPADVFYEAKVDKRTLQLVCDSENKIMGQFEKD